MVERQGGGVYLYPSCLIEHRIELRRLPGVERHVFRLHHRVLVHHCVSEMDLYVEVDTSLRSTGEWLDLDLDLDLDLPQQFDFAERSREILTSSHEVGVSAG